jgi:lipid A 3-O-deacylase
MLFAAALAVLASPATSFAQSDAGTAPSTQFRDGSKHVALLAGYGVGFRVGSRRNRRISRELSDVNPVNIVPRLGVGITDPIGSDNWWRGNVEILIEGAFLINTGPTSGFAGGAGTTLRYNFLRNERLVPFVDLNFGILGMDFDLERQADGFNFNVGTGVGTHWFLTKQTALTVEARWQHISNAGTKQENDGINDALFLVGLTFFYD